MRVMELGGYLHPAYAHCLAEFGTPRCLPTSGAWILTRFISSDSARDAMGCYPIFSCPDWSGLSSDLQRLDDLVCISVVTDPFGDYDLSLLRECFPDLVRPFKQHFVVDLHADPRDFLSPHHRRNVQKSLRSVHVMRCEDPASYAAEWIALYSHLIRRHAIRGIPAFSEVALRRQLEVPGLYLFRAALDDKAAGMILFMVHGNVAYYHLGAYSEAGYHTRASYALFSTALEFFHASPIRWLSLGAGEGLRDEGETGLTRFKRGWSTGTRLAYLCGRILDHDAYARLVEQKDARNADYFPAYRKGEFG